MQGIATTRPKIVVTIACDTPAKIRANPAVQAAYLGGDTEAAA